MSTGGGGSGPNRTQAVLVFSQLADNGRIPAGSTIHSATLSLLAANHTTSTQISVFRMLMPVNERRPWNSTGDGIDRDGIEAAAARSFAISPISTL